MSNDRVKVARIQNNLGSTSRDAGDGVAALTRAWNDILTERQRMTMRV